MKNKSLLIFMSIILAFGLIGWGDADAVEYLDGSLVFHGKASEQLCLRTKDKRDWELYDYDIFHLRSTFKLETRWDAFKGGAYNLTFYSVFNNFYDAAHWVDTGYRKYLEDFSRSRYGYFLNQYQAGGSKGISQVESYETFRDICRELYVELNNPNWQIRVGRQIVSWGEASFERMADIVNPVDARGNLNPAYPDFDEIKRGLFMVKLTLTPPDFYQDMFLELYCIPEFLPNRNWPAGYHLVHPESFNALVTPDELFRPDYRDYPESWSDPALGFRLRGITCGFDWAFMFLYHRNPTSTIREGEGAASQFPALFGRGRAEDVKRYGHQVSLAFTFNKTVDRTFTFPGCSSLNMSGNIWRGEFLVELDKDHNRGYTPEVKEHNRYAFVMGWDTWIQIPWLSDWNRNRKLSSSTQWVMEWVPDRHRDDFIYPWVTYGEKRHHESSITETLWYDFWQSRIIPAIYVAGRPSDGRWYYAPALSFKPTYSWTYMIRYINYMDHADSRHVNSRDFITFDITYEF